MRSTLFAMLIVTLTLVPLLSSAEDMDVEVYGGYPGCDRWMHTNFFEILPGEIVVIHIDLNECSEAYFKYGFVFYGYKDKLANYLAKKDGIEFEIYDADGDAMDPKSYDGCYLSGKSTGVWLNLTGPTDMWLSATNTKRKSQSIRLQSSTNIIRPKGC